ncbi:hypothetical protein K438DRAFT_1786809 [Mycena galopus ATCC 62051]|nr:hypothetical protein K438DRAFT_1786809 [Mycena galopus ATCC 62051]
MYLVNGQPATTGHSHQPQSQLSRHYAHSLGLSVTAPTIFVSISITASGRSAPIFITQEPFAVHLVDNISSDVLLGSDWFALCRAAASTGDVVFPAGTYEAMLNETTPTSVLRRGDPVDPSLSVSRGWPDGVAPPTVLSSVEVPAMQESAMQTESMSALQAESSSLSRINNPSITIRIPL